MTAVRRSPIEQNWQAYREEEHAIWRFLFERQQRLLVGRACREHLEGLTGLGVAADGIPDFRDLSDILDRATGWRYVAVPGLVPTTFSSPTSPAAGSRQPVSSGAVTSSTIFRSRTSSMTSAAMSRC